MAQRSNIFIVWEIAALWNEFLLWIRLLMKNVKIYGKKNASVKNGKCQLKMLAFSIQVKVFHLLKENQFEPDKCVVFSCDLLIFEMLAPIFPFLFSSSDLFFK